MVKLIVADKSKPIKDIEEEINDFLSGNKYLLVDLITTTLAGIDDKILYVITWYNPADPDSPSRRQMAISL